MPTLNKNLYEIKTRKSNIFNKLNRYFLEKQLGKLSNKHLFKHKQMAIFAFDYISNQINIDGIYEVDDLNIFIEWLESLNNKEIFQGAVLDIGANIGNHSLFLSSYFKEIYSYEPHPLNYQLLLYNSKLVNNIKCFNIGISSTESTGLLEFNNANMGGARLGNLDFVSINNVKNKVILNTIDNLLESDKDKIIVKLIKIDIEGHEYDALIGAENTIKKFQPIIILEQHITEFYDGTSNVINLLNSFGYELFAKIEKNPSPLKYLPNFLNLTYSTFFRLLFGSSIKIKMVKSFQPNFYPFIIAIPKHLI